AIPSAAPTPAPIATDMPSLFFRSAMVSVSTRRQYPVPRLNSQLCQLFPIRRRLELNFYLVAPKARLKFLKHFMSTNCSLINSTSKLCRVDERVAKRTFPTLRLEPVDGLVDLLATFRACDFQRQIVEKHGLVQTINKIS